MPDSFDSSFRKNTRKRVETVGELIAELSQLPPDMAVYTSKEERPRVYVTRVLAGRDGEWLAMQLDTEEWQDT